jgi:hypothetical protein
MLVVFRLTIEGAKPILRPLTFGYMVARGKPATNYLP